MSAFRFKGCFWRHNSIKMICIQIRTSKGTTIHLISYSVDFPISLHLLPVFFCHHNARAATSDVTVTSTRNWSIFQWFNIWLLWSTETPEFRPTLSSTSVTFTFMYLADTFIQSDLQCIHVIHLYCQYMCSLGIEPTTFALLTQCSNHWATGTQLCLKRHLSIKMIWFVFSHQPLQRSLR